eukprot:TRINITY_DN5881_c0_g1_i1.p1 TRINITY_DN5881_c0_g1~~TRINITY_DN5881_c0_g1_i1.p1  ORF type:complete len:668 (+),score=117.69 TRINITY_DN5881_c0_g1_i1:2-2005(+)
MEPVVSVVLPIYNDIKYSEQSVNSILSQTFTDYELIIVDDGSNVETKLVIKTLAERDPRIKVITQNENGGVANALNAGIGQSCGKYIARMDSDDIAEPNRLERQVSFLEQHNDVHIVGGSVLIFGDGVNERVVEHPANPGEVHFAMFFNCSVVHPSIMVRRCVFEKFRYPVTYPSAEDYALWLNIISDSTDSYKFANLPQPPILKLRKHISNSSKVYRSTQHDSTIQALSDTLVKICKDKLGKCSPKDVSEVFFDPKKINKENSETVVNVVEQIERYLCSQNFDSNNKSMIRKETTKQLGLFSSIGLHLYSSPAESVAWRRWLSRNSPDSLLDLFSKLNVVPNPTKQPTPTTQKKPRSLERLTVICFSKDRAFQLKEYLRSLFKYVKHKDQTTTSIESKGDNVDDDDHHLVQMDVRVLYKATEKFVKSYEKLTKMFPLVKWIEETDFTTQLKDIIDTSSDYILWGVDDVFYYDTFNPYHSMKILENNADIICSSFRLFPKVTFCHPANSNSKVPSSFEEMCHDKVTNTKTIRFDRNEGSQDWNYPFELCATLFRKDDVDSIMQTIEKHFGIEGLSHPNKLEVCGSRIFTRSLDPIHKHKFCLCLDKPVLSVITVNRVQDVCCNPIFVEIDLDTLDEYFWNDRLFDDNLYREKSSTFNSVHIGDFHLQ